MGVTGPASALTTVLVGAWYTVTRLQPGLYAVPGSGRQQPEKSLDEVLAQKIEAPWDAAWADEAPVDASMEAGLGARAIGHGDCYRDGGAASAAAAADPLADMLQASRRIGDCLYDAGADLTASGLAVIWPWPVDTGAAATSTPALPVGINASEIWNVVEDFVLPLVELIPPELATHAVSASSWPLDAVAPAAKVLLQGFLERHPQHAGFLLGLGFGFGRERAAGQTLLWLAGFAFAALCLALGFLWVISIGARCLTWPCRRALGRGQASAEGVKRRRASSALDRVQSRRVRRAASGACQEPSAVGGWPEVYNAPTPARRRPRHETTGDLPHVGW
eukprot:TRINITY_DN14142_c0_g1_i2.p1 TRINITY_DN14142_c0_g1~~TRINITY_DN14142_c0_g1_i2.p1  ORF type:complete len:335 (+),score=58.81 TRINITY_DN14142_c0_g1_i2:74-1078(+)